MLNLYIVVTYASKYANNRQEAESVAANLVSKYRVGPGNCRSPCSLESLLKRQVNRNRRRLVGLLHFIKMVLRTPFSLRMTGLNDKWKSIGVSSTSTPSWAAIHTGEGHVCWMCREWERERAVSQQQTTGPKGWAHPQIGQKRVGPQAHTDIII